MQKLKVDLENCYGIRKLEKEFDFSDQRTYVIYAPNGSMKSSFAQTFKDVSEGVGSRDRIFPARPCKRGITDENGDELPKETVLVLPPYDEFFSHTPKTSTLLVNNALRKEYEQLHEEINSSKATFLKGMKEQCGSKRDLEKEISLTFTKSDSSFHAALMRIKDEVREQKDAPFAFVRYDVIFDERVLDAIEGKDFKAAIQEYISRYNELLAASTYFKKGIFEYYNANQIAKTLADNGFFAAKHSIRLNADTVLEITTEKQLAELISKELDGITEDIDLKKRFAALKKLLEKNATLREFQAYLVEHELLLPHLGNIELFRELVWKSYFKTRNGLFSDLIDKYQKVQERKKEIEQEAGKERTQWERVIDLFNERFFVPFTLEAKNRVAVRLGQEQLLDLSFTFKDGPETAPVERDALLKVLSQGEKKALYILNIIFEVEVRRQSKQQTLFVVDDIADSFDYKNKYAIIQYLKDISDEPHFRQIILTHNFDFFRTVSSRFVGYSRCLMASRNSAGLSLDQAVGIRNPFVNNWKERFFKDSRKKIASIPFIRNLIEYTRGEDDPEYLKLTSLLHWKPDSGAITVRELDDVYKKLFGTAGASAKPDTPVVVLIHDEARACLEAPQGANFEHKIVLSVAIRLAAERFMVDKIAEPDLVRAIDKNQTHTLLAKFTERFAGEVETIKTLHRVALMTPENIHLNSFMYEPILDMSDEGLRKLYQDVAALA